MKVIDYTTHSPLRNHLHETFDAIFDIVGEPGLWENSPKYLVSDGWFIALGQMAMTGAPSWWGLLSWLIPAKLGTLRPVMLGGVPRKYRMYQGQINEKDMERVMELVKDGKVTVPVDSVWKMDDAKQVSRSSFYGVTDTAQAYERVQSQRARGKVVIDVGG